ncbi:anaerobic ribonucleoside-triphosphate reductase activating protein [Chitiniphilus purpureus]|uniref:Anaerobic ribonucleoside-triphosphate reductase activating protein n=1 Tax=Chitiniphilus purpureus TaxID=2981137 RepID=A0ABY6DNT1_9NEIS|nr:anaerobic ribonucleoside-triphosphate reductase activating protein [Chitiniphilus sp. CD1]UXY15873.1 anaerobic ribonucleoside-triphosphate reductase activating protein [Chitiniphilus sp. CD1]
MPIPAEDTARQPKLGGFVPFSGCDYPGQLACVVFTAGCPWRCRYCHNPHLQARQAQPGLPGWEQILAWLPLRQGLLDGMVFCGGEPLTEPLLPRMMAQVKALGFKVALHTGGAYPARLRDCLPYLDWVGFDVKHQFGEYAQVTQVAGSGSAAHLSLQLLRASGVPFECRTTYHPALHDERALLALGERLAAAGVDDYALQLFRAEGCNDAALLAQAGQPPGEAVLRELGTRFARFTVRG